MRIVSLRWHRFLLLSERRLLIFTIFYVRWTTHHDDCHLKSMMNQHCWCWLLRLELCQRSASASANASVSATSCFTHEMYMLAIFIHLSWVFIHISSPFKLVFTLKAATTFFVADNISERIAFPAVEQPMPRTLQHCPPSSWATLLSSFQLAVPCCNPTMAHCCSL